MDQILKIGKCLSNKNKIHILNYVHDNPGCTFYDIRSYVHEQTGTLMHHEIMREFTAAGVLFYEKRGRVKHFRVAILESDPLHSVLFNDRERVEHNVETDDDVDLSEICYLWNRYRRDKMWASKRHSWGIDDLVIKTGLAKTWLIRFTHGEVNATMRDFIRLCDLIGIKPSTIFRQVDK